jgi:hypothetical protein
MYKALTQIFAFMCGIIGEALVLRLIAKVQLWWELEVSEQVKAQADVEYQRLFKESKDLGDPNK